MSSLLKVEEEHVAAQDARSSAVALCLVVLGAMGVGLATSSSVLWSAGDLGRAIAALQIAQAVGAMAGLAILVVERRDPRPQISMAVFACVFLTQLPMMFAAAEAWRRVGRPVEAFVQPHVVLVAASLIVPTRLRFGVAIVVGLAIETVGIWLYLRARAPEELLPIGEPMISIQFAMVALALLWMRDGRRTITRRYLRATAELATLDALGASLEALVTSLERELGELGRRFAALPSTLEPAARALAAASRLERLGASLRAAIAARPGAAPAPVHRRGEPEAPLERAFFARDANQAALRWAAIICFLYATSIAAARSLPSFARYVRWIWPIEAAAALAWLGIFVARRRAPSTALALVGFLCLEAPNFWTWWIADGVALPSQPRPYELFIGAHLAIALAPIVVPRYAWLGLAIDLLITGECFVVYDHFHLASLRDRVGLYEPWLTLYYLGIGLGLLLVRDRRRAVSLALLRKDAQLTALARQAGLSMALLDRMGSPLQLLVIEVAQLAARGVPPEEIDPIRATLDRLIALERSLPRQAIRLGIARESFDAEYEISRRETAAAPDG